MRAFSHEQVTVKTGTKILPRLGLHELQDQAMPRPVISPIVSSLNPASSANILPRSA